METIEFGTSKATLSLDDDGLMDGSISGLLLPSNAGALSALLLRAAADRDASGLLCSVENALVALPPIDAPHYAYVPPTLRKVPVAVVVLPEQLNVYETVAQAAAASGAIRRAFLSREQAQAWLREQARALQANRLWRQVRRSPP